MGLRNCLWHCLPNGIIMRNLIYGKWRKEKIQQESMRASLPRFFGARSNRFAGPFITVIEARLKLKHS